MANTSERRAEDEDPFTRMVRQEADQLCTEITDMDEREATNKLLSLCGEWEIDNDLCAEELLRISFRNFRWNEQEATRQTDYGLNHLLRVIQLRQVEAMSLMQTMKRLDLLEDDLTYGRIKRVLEKVFYCTRLSLSVVQLKVAGSTAYCVPKNIDDELGCMTLRFRWVDDVNAKDIHTLIWYLLDVAFERGYKKQGTNLFKPIVVDGHHTHAYERECDIKTFVHTHCRREVNVEAHVNLLKVSMQTVLDYLENNVDIQLPFLNKDRTVFSFRNGVYTCRDDTFHPYATTVLSDDTYAANFFDNSIDESIFEMDWRDISTPNIEKIFMDQKLSVEVRHWFYVMAGRMLYTLGERDGWQVVPFLLGVAGSGKSTVTDMLIGNIYDRVDVGVLSNNCERQWAVSGLIRSLLWVCPEVKDDFNLEQGTCVCDSRHPPPIDRTPTNFVSRSSQPCSRVWCRANRLASLKSSRRRTARRSISRGG